MAIAQCDVRVGIVRAVCGECYPDFFFGSIVRRSVGNLGFFLLYLVSGIGAALLALLWDPLQMYACAPGAGFGMAAGALGVRLRQRGRDPVPDETYWGIARWSIFVLLALRLIHSIDPKLGLDIVAMAVPALGGVAAGITCGLLLGQREMPSTTAEQTRRNIRALVFAMILLGCGIAGAKARYPHLPELDQFLGRFAALDRDINSAYIAGGPNDRSCGDAIERDVLPRWRSLRTDADDLPSMPSVYSEDIAAIRDYLRLREEGWELLVRALRLSDKSDDAYAAARAREWKKHQAREARDVLESARDRRRIAETDGLLSRPPWAGLGCGQE